RIPAALGPPERALNAVGGFVLFSVACMVGHIVTGGVVFGLPGVLPVLGAAALWVGRSSFRGIPVPRWSFVGVAAVALLCLFVLPALLGGSGVRSGDPPWHLGWAEQLLAGEPVPLGPAPEYARNAYPWGWHALLAALVRLVPGSTPLVAHESLHVMIVAALPLAVACLARRGDRRAGAAAAAVAGLVGGLGWLLADHPELVTSPSEALGAADLVVTSPNALYSLLPPALPRELALVLLGLAGVLALSALSSPSRGTAALCGAVMGTVGLLSVPLLLTAAVWVTLAAILIGGEGRAGVCASMAGTAAVVAALWAGPVIADYLRFGGFVDVSVLGMEWPLTTALASWGLLLPLAAAGVALAAERAFRADRGRSEAVVLLAWAASIAVWVGVTVLARGARGGLAGNGTLLHQGRVWPVAHLLGAAFAGVALLGLYRVIARRSQVLAATGCGLLLGLGAASPAIASLQMTEIIKGREAGWVYAAPDLAAGSFLRRAAAHLGPDDIVRVRGSDGLAWALWQFSGVRLADYDDPTLEGNDLRVRYADLARAWDRRMAAGGFRPNYVVLPVGEAPGDREVLERGTFEGRRWALVVS
ncbi:MAG: hypothetical protein M3333_01410, partial [Actinomycetota bacterium]|nr:hypothetical protein [Actinomycetota bacterium]